MVLAGIMQQAAYAGLPSARRRQAPAAGDRALLLRLRILHGRGRAGSSV